MGILKDFYNRKINAQEEYPLPTGQTISSEDFGYGDEDIALKDPHEAFWQVAKFSLDNIDTTKELLYSLQQNVPPSLVADVETLPMDDPDFVFGGAIEKLDLVDEFIKKNMKAMSSEEVEEALYPKYKDWYREQIRKPGDPSVQYESEVDIGPSDETLTY